MAHHGETNMGSSTPNSTLPAGQADCPPGECCGDCGGHIDGVPLTDQELDSAGTAVSGMDYETFKETMLPQLQDSLKDGISAQDLEQFAKFSYANYGVAKALPGLQNLSDDERASVIGQLGEAAMNKDYATIQQIMQQYGNGTVPTVEDAKAMADLVMYGAGSHDNFGTQDDWLHGIVSSDGADNTGFALNHFTHFGEVDGQMVGFRGADEQGRQNGVYEAFLNLDKADNPALT